jgi:hypothetical protein
MKLDKPIKKSNGARGNSNGPFVAIGDRGVTCPPMETGFPEEMELNGHNKLPPKLRTGTDTPGKPLYQRCHAFVQSRRGTGKLWLGTLAYALSHKLVKVLEDVQVERKVPIDELPTHQRADAPKGLTDKATGKIVMPGDWEPGMKMPKFVGFIPDNERSWVGGRVESSLIAEPQPRNAIVVGKIILPEKYLKNAKKDDAKKGDKKDAKKSAKPVKAAIGAGARDGDTKQLTARTVKSPAPKIPAGTSKPAEAVAA